VSKSQVQTYDYLLSDLNRIPVIRQGSRLTFYANQAMRHRMGLDSWKWEVGVGNVEV